MILLFEEDQTCVLFTGADLVEEFGGEMPSFVDLCIHSFRIEQLVLGYMRDRGDLAPKSTCASLGNLLLRFREQPDYVGEVGSCKEMISVAGL